MSTFFGGKMGSLTDQSPKNSFYWRTMNKKVISKQQLLIVKLEKNENKPLISNIYICTNNTL